MSHDALYHRRGWKPKACTVAATHEDGAVDLAGDDGEVFVTRCAVFAEDDPGTRPDGWAELLGPPKKKRGRPRKSEPALESLPAADLEDAVGTDDEPPVSSPEEDAVTDTEA